MGTLRQTNFAAGEIDPLLWGRTDLSLYAQGLRTARNFFITREGSAMSRPGTRYVNTVKNIAAYTGGTEPERPVRLVPFIAGDGASCVIEFGELYCRFHTLGRTLELPPGTPYEIVTPYAAVELPLLRFAQVGDVLSIAGARNPAELRRNGATSWVLTDIDFAPPAPLFQDPETPFDTTSGFAVVTPEPAADATHPNREWQWLVTVVARDPVSGSVVETTGDLVSEEWDGVDYDGTVVPLTDDLHAIYPDRALTLARGDSAAAVPPGYVVLAFNIYRGRGDLFGFIGQTKSRAFVDTGTEPDYGVQPPRGTNPFRVAYAGFTGLEVPYSVGFYEERRWFGGSGINGNNPYKRPSRLFGSKVGDYYTHDLQQVVHTEREAVEFELGAMKREQVQHLIGLERLVALTTAGAWTVGNAGPVTSTTPGARRIDDVGASLTTPLVVNGSVLFIRTKGTGARALVPGGDSDKAYQGVDLSQRARHLVVGASKTIVDWCFQEDPFGVVWAVRADGKLLSLTFDKEMLAWTRHDSDVNDAGVALGVFEAICSVPEGEEDAVYAVVRRNINGGQYRYIERFTSRVRRVLEDNLTSEFLTAPAADDTDSLYPTDLCLDCSFTYSGAPTNIISDPLLEKLNHKYVYVIARGSPVLGPFEVNGSPGTIDLTDALPELPEPNAVDGGGLPIWVAHIGLKYDCDLETLAIRGGDTVNQKTVTQVGFELDNARGIFAGQDFEHLNEWQQRDVGDEYNAISAATLLLTSPVENVWDKDARAVLRQSLPLPVTVVGITREVDKGD